MQKVEYGRTINVNSSHRSGRSFATFAPRSPSTKFVTSLAIALLPPQFSPQVAERVGNEPKEELPHPGVIWNPACHTESLSIITSLEFPVLDAGDRPVLGLPPISYPFPTCSFSRFKRVVVACVSIDCPIRAENSKLPEGITKDNEDTHRRDCECVNFNCGCHSSSLARTTLRRFLALQR